MNKKQINKSELVEISLTKKILISANIFYFLLFLGFCFTSNLDNPTIFHKYTVGYVKSLMGLLLLIIPYNLFILFILKDSFSISYNKKSFRITFFWRIITVALFIILVLLLTELFLRMKPKPYVEDFHPFLQAMTTKKNEGYLHVNSESFRYDEMTVAKPTGVYRIFLVGGSTVYDKTRSYDQSISKVVENQLRKHYHTDKIQVINAGYERYTSEHSLILYETKIQDYQPDLIVYWQGFNDMYYSCIPDIPGFSPIKTYKNDYSHFYEVLDNVVNGYFNYYLHSLVVDRLTKAFTQNFYADLRNRIPKPKSQVTYRDITNWPSLDAYIRNTSDMVKLAKSDNVKIIIGNQPNHYNSNPKNYGLMQYYCRNGNVYASPKSINKGMALFNKASKDIANKNDVPFVDLESQLPKTDQYFTDDVHYTDAGDKKVADTVYKAIASSNYLENK